MGFRERPEYDEWRAAVFARFGETCIACGYAGNIHAHHVRPVETFPELAFDPNNGVPLCGNCHTETYGKEMDFVAKFEELQMQVLGISPAPAATIEELKSAAEANPADPDAVAAFLGEDDDSQQAVDFYIKYEKSIKKTRMIVELMSWRLFKVGRHSDAIRFADAALAIARREGNAPISVGGIAAWKVRSLAALGRGDEVAPCLEALLGEFPEDAELHYKLSFHLRFEAPDKGQWDECLAHATRAIQLCPDKSLYLDHAAGVYAMFGRFKEALGYARRAFSCATDDEERISAIETEAGVFERGKLYDDAIGAYRKALAIEPENANILADIAHALYMLDRVGAAAEMAKRSLFHDPNNESAKGTLSCCQRELE